MQAPIERLATFAQHGQPKDYAASDMMRADLEALIMQAIAQPVQPIIKTVVKLTPDQEENLHAGRTTKETFTVVYLGPSEEELKVIMSHPKSIWLGWCHAPYERDEARAALTQTGAGK